MDWVMGTTVIAGLFVLRLGIPLAVIALVITWLHRLEAGWEA